jgi:hypothetical protein
MNGKQFLYIILATFVTISAWAIFDILHSRSQVQPAPEIKALLEPLNPKLDLTILDDI